MTDEPGYESIYAAYLTADIRPAIRTAGIAGLHAALTLVAELLCHQARDDFGRYQALGNEVRPPYQVCDVGRGIEAGMQLYRYVTQAVAADLLNSMGFETVRLIADRQYMQSIIIPSITAATMEQSKKTLIDLANHVDAIVKDGVISSLTSAEAADSDAIDDELQGTAKGAALAIDLYGHAVQQMSVHLLFRIWDGLGCTRQPGTTGLRLLTSEEHLSSNPN